MKKEANFTNPNYKLNKNGETFFSQNAVKESFPEGKTGIHSVDAARKVGQRVIDAENRAQEAERKAEEALENSYRDSLTGCYNKKYLIDYLSKVDPNRSHGEVGFIFADINNLKTTNDGLGHEAGDELIKNTADFLKSTFRMGDSVVRTGGDVVRAGGDEFVVICENRQDQNNKGQGKKALSFEEGLRNKIQKILEENSINNLAVGVAVFDLGKDHSVSETVKRADVEMLRRKRDMKEGRQESKE